MKIYLDTNFFIYFADPNFPTKSTYINVISYCIKNKIDLCTSVETIQEIIHYSKNIKRLEFGLEAAELVYKAVDSLIPINTKTIEIYLDLASNYKSSSSRDLIHLATCLENSIELILTHDKDFKKFKEIASKTPEEFLAN